MPDGSALTPPQEEKIPYSIEAEQAVLGAILFDNEVFYRVSSFLKPEHYYDPVHAMLYEAIDKLILKGKLASPVMLNTYLGDEPAFKDVGGEQYLTTLARSVPSTVGAADYARVVFDLATSRGLIRLGTDMIEKARAADIDEDPQTQLASAEAELYALAETGKYGSGFEKFESALKVAIELTNAAYQRGGGRAGRCFLWLSGP